VDRAVAVLLELADDALYVAPDGDVDVHELGVLVAQHGVGAAQGEEDSGAAREGLEVASELCWEEGTELLEELALSSRPLHESRGASPAAGDSDSIQAAEVRATVSQFLAPCARSHSASACAPIRRWSSWSVLPFPAPKVQRAAEPTSKAVSQGA
jgi:hypothetical protein